MLEISEKTWKLPNQTNLRLLNAKINVVLSNPYIPEVRPKRKIDFLLLDVNSTSAKSTARCFSSSGETYCNGCLPSINNLRNFSSVCKLWRRSFEFINQQNVRIAVRWFRQFIELTVFPWVTAREMIFSTCVLKKFQEFQVEFFAELLQFYD